jgi:hypothetical protein
LKIFYLKFKKITVLLCAGLICVFSSNVFSVSKSDEPAVHKVQINPLIWVEASKLQWPGKNQYVNVVMGATSATTICGKSISKEVMEKLNSKNVSHAGLTFGVACRELWVLFPANDLKKMKVNAHQEKAVAAHEAFHMAVQYFSSRKIRIERAMDYNYAMRLAMPKKRETNNFFKKISDISKGKLGDSKLHCSSLLASYREYDSWQIDYIRNRIDMEWPAEFYMREAYFLDESEEYEVFRNDLFKSSSEAMLYNGNIIYSAGTEAIKAIEQTISRKDWQNRYLQGETLLNIYFESIGCEKPDPYAPIGMSKGIGDSELITQ